MSDWLDLSADVLAEFAHFEHGIACITNDGPELPYVATRFLDADAFSPGQRWVEGDACEKAAIEAALLASARAVQVAERTVDLEVDRRLGIGPGTLPPLGMHEVAEVRRLAKKGLSGRAIERRTGVGRNRVARLLKKEAA